MKNKICVDVFSVKALENKDLAIEGWANKSIVDRGNDIIYKDAWVLDNFKKNPVMLFNHDMSKPIGKILDCMPMDGGLWVKGVLSKSSDPTVSYVRDLVEEGILNSFSVGFDAKEEFRNPEGFNEIKKAELYEVSIVSLPMNQDSNFSLATKSFEGLAYKDIKKMVLDAKGALVASLIHSKLEELGDQKDGKLNEVCTKGECTPEEMNQVLSGQMTPVSEKVLGAVAEVLGIPMEDLNAANVQDQEKPVEEETPPPPPEEKKVTMDVVAIKVLKNSFSCEKAALIWAAETGWKSEAIKEDGEHFVIFQAKEDEFENIQEVELEHGVKALMGSKKQVGEGGGSVSANEAPKVDDNPYLQQARQTNILLAMIVSKLDALMQKPVEQVVPPPPPAAVAATVDDANVLQKYMADVDKRLKDLGL